MRILDKIIENYNETNSETNSENYSENGKYVDVIVFDTTFSAYTPPKDLVDIYAENVKDKRFEYKDGYVLGQLDSESPYKWLKLK